jgi:hypothetical protein
MDKQQKIIILNGINDPMVVDLKFCFPHCKDKNEESVKPKA